MAAALAKQVGIEADLEVGNPGEFTVWVDHHVVASKQAGQFPSPEAVVEAVRRAIPRPGT